MVKIGKKLALISLLVLPLLSFSQEKKVNDWVMNKDNSDDKFKVIQKQMRGFDMAMVETGIRFNTFYFALKDKNYDLATYQWKKIKLAIENGIERRPKRAPTAKAMFLDSAWGEMMKAVDSKNEKQIWSTYEVTKGVCNACHTAERVPFFKVVDPKSPLLPF